MTAFEEIRLKFTSVEPLKYGANAAAEFDDPNWPRFVRITDVDGNGRLREDTFRSLPPEIAEPFKLQVGDILLARSGATVGKSFIYDNSWGNACYAGYLIRLRTSDHYIPKYVYWYLQSSKYWSDIESNLIQSTIQNVSAERYANFRVPSPPLGTQRRIVQFLDDKTARIDGLIEKKRALLDRLAEKRQALITRAVTKGLNPDASMKPSGIDWIGDIPAHWEVLPLRRMVLLQRGHDLPSREREEGEVLLVSSAGVIGNHSVKISDGPGIVTGRYGTIGDFYYINAPYWPLNTTLYSKDIRCFPGFGFRMLQAMSHMFVLNSLKSAVPGVDRNDVLSESVPSPPLGEQLAISEEIDLKENQIFENSRLVEKSIRLLQEYRSSLITAAVIGQVEGSR